MRIKLTTIAHRSALALACAASLCAQPIGQWDFNSGTLAGTVGGALEYFDGPGGATELGTQFGTTTALGIPDIGGEAANVMRVPKATDGSMGLIMPVNSTGNGGGELVNTYTLIFDLLFPAESSGKWRGLLEADNQFLEPDAEFFVNPANGIGISGNYSGTIEPNTWYRVGLVMEGETKTMRKYIDGVLVGSQTFANVDDRFAFAPNGTATLFTDNDGETEVSYVNSIQLRNTALSAADMAALGGASAAGIPQQIGARPSFVEGQAPAPGATGVSPLPTLSGVVNPGDETVAASSVRLSLDGTDLPATAAQEGGVLRISQVITNLLAPLTEHTVSIRYADGTGSKTNTWTFTVGDYKALTLPAPITLETFDNVEEGMLPAGWTVTNRTDSSNPVFDVMDAHSDSYLDFVVISRATLSSVFNANRLLVQPYLVNGALVPELVINQFAYAESDVRSGSQVQVLFSPDFNIAGKSNIFLSFHSIYAQNQDDIAGVEYSVDGGQSWQPGIYMIDGPDIVRAGEEIDAEATLSTVRTDQAHGEAYGSFIGVDPSRWSQLGPFISQRVDDNHTESKRIELIRLAEADGKQNVRLRFFQAGTASWYFGVDNVGIYSIEQALPPSITRAPVSVVVSGGTTATLTVEAAGEGLSYQWKFNGTDIPGATSAVLSLPNVQAGNEGSYTVLVKNSGGEATSAPALLRIFNGAIADELVAHLKFENDLADSSGRNNNGEAVGGPTFQPGLIGSAVHIPSGFDYVTLGAPADLNFGVATDFSVSFWAQVIDFAGDPSFVANKDWNSGGNQGYVIAADDDRRVQWNLSGAPGTRKDFDSPGNVFSADGWHHIVVTFNRQGNATTYIDGAARDSRSIAADQNDVSTPEGQATNIGQDGTGNYGSAFNDLNVDDLGIWRRVLTPQEVAAIHTAGRAGKDLSTVTVGSANGPVNITGVQRAGTNLSITVSGAGTLQLQKKSSLSDAWSNVAATAVNGVFTVPMDSAAGFYRVAAQ